MHTQRAYAIGYYDGRAIGAEENPYSGETQPQEHAAYAEGYECGVADYCRAIEPAHSEE